MESLISILVVMPEAISAVVAVVSLAVAAWQAFRRRQYQAGFELSDDALRGVVAAIELLPDSPERDKTKSVIRRMAETLGTESEVLARTVKSVEAALDAAGVRTDGDDTGYLVRAAQAAAKYRVPEVGA
jgi:hypothetical protein